MIKGEENDAADVYNNRDPDRGLCDDGVKKMSKLKPCPFCGSDAAVFVKEDASFPYRVQCLNEDCSCRTDNYKAYSFATEAWNRRAGEEDE